MLDNTSVVIITKNAAHVLRETLASTIGFDEVVIYDNGSEDDTLDIVREFANTSLHQGEFMGFGPTKNHAVGLAKNDWVFSLDADEVVSEELLEYLSDWQPQSDKVAGIVRRDNYFLGEKVDKGGWGSDWLVRIFNRQVHRFNDNAVHEKVQLREDTLKLTIPHEIRHKAVNALSDFLQKIDHYTEIHAESSDKTFHPAVIFLRASWAFFRSYVLQGGFLAGWRGLVIAWNESNGTFYKYMKVYVRRQNEQN